MKLPFMRTDSAEPAAPTGGGGLLRVLVPLALVSLVVASIGVFYLSAQRSAVDARFFTLFDRLQVLAQTVAKEAGVAVSGRDGAFRRLEAAAGEFDATLVTLADGDAGAGLPPLPGEAGLGAALGALNDTWSEVRAQSTAMVAAQPVANGFAARVESWESAKVGVLEDLSVFIAALQNAYAASPQLLGAADIAATLERVTASMRQVLAGGQDAGAAADQLRVESAAIAERLDIFAGDAPGSDDGVEAVEDPLVRDALDRLVARYATARAIVDEAVGFTEGVLALQDASERVVESDESMLARIRALADGYRRTVGARPLSDALGIALGAGALVMLLLLGLQLTRAARERADRERALAEEARRREEQTRNSNQANQDAILRLLDEIGDLADGDLTTNATVTEDITGAIADAINFTIEALRDTVFSINEASVKMVDAASSSRETALRLTQSSEIQATQIEAAATSVRALAEASRGVSGDAARGQEVATQQVRHANEGADAVRATIDGMDVIRETIQETSKRIKRLGESSQEIGEIVSLIDDIADQTNILALNAAIQASMAGEQGRGFAVVADEVQRLAERASQATRQIDGLVKAIQSDTNEAVASMEQSTAGVVRGAGLAEDAGQALVRIELVSKDLEGIASGIAGSANGQTEQAGQVARSMDEIQRMTTESRAGTQETASAIGGLAQLATDLRTSVAGFRLPADGDGDGDGRGDGAAGP